MSLNIVPTAFSLSYKSVPFAQRFDDLHEMLDDFMESDDPSNEPMLLANTLTASYIRAGSACTQNTPRKLYEYGVQGRLGILG